MADHKGTFYSRWQTGMSSKPSGLLIPSWYDLDDQTHLFQFKKKIKYSLGNVFKEKRRKNVSKGHTQKILSVSCDKKNWSKTLKYFGQGKLKFESRNQ